MNIKEFLLIIVYFLISLGCGFMITYNMTKDTETFVVIYGFVIFFILLYALFTIDYEE